MIDYERAKRNGPKLKAALTRAQRQVDPLARYAAVRSACFKAVQEWNAWGAWPDGWAIWENALSDAAYAAARSGGSQISYVYRLRDL